MVSAAWSASISRAQWKASVLWTGFPPRISYIRSCSAWARGVAIPSEALSRARGATR